MRASQAAPQRQGSDRATAGHEHEQREGDADPLPAAPLGTASGSARQQEFRRRVGHWMGV